VDVIFFEQTFPVGLNQTAIPQMPGYGDLPSATVPFSEFPAFDYNEQSVLQSKLGYIEWQGTFLSYFCRVVLCCVGSLLEPWFLLW